MASPSSTQIAQNMALGLPTSAPIAAAVSSSTSGGAAAAAGASNTQNAAATTQAAAGKKSAETKFIFVPGKGYVSYGVLAQDIASGAHEYSITAAQNRAVMGAQAPGFEAGIRGEYERAGIDIATQRYFVNQGAARLYSNATVADYKAVFAREAAASSPTYRMTATQRQVLAANAPQQFDVIGEGKLADQLAVAQYTGLPLASVQANWGNLSKGAPGYEAQAGTAVRKAQETGKPQFVAGVGDITVASSAAAPSSTSEEQITSRTVNWFGNTTQTENYSITMNTLLPPKGMSMMQPENTTARDIGVSITQYFQGNKEIGGTLTPITVYESKPIELNWTREGGSVIPENSMQMQANAALQAKYNVLNLDTTGLVKFETDFGRGLDNFIMTALGKPNFTTERETYIASENAAGRSVPPLGILSGQRGIGGFQGIFTDIGGFETLAASTVSGAVNYVAQPYNVRQAQTTQFFGSISDTGAKYSAASAKGASMKHETILGISRDESLTLPTTMFIGATVKAGGEIVQFAVQNPITFSGLVYAGNKFSLIGKAIPISYAVEKTKQGKFDEALGGTIGLGLALRGAQDMLLWRAKAKAERGTEGGVQSSMMYAMAAKLLGAEYKGLNPDQIALFRATKTPRQVEEAISNAKAFKSVDDYLTPKSINRSVPAEFWTGKDILIRAVTGKNPTTLEIIKNPEYGLGRIGTRDVQASMGRMQGSIIGRVRLGLAKAQAQPSFWLERQSAKLAEGRAQVGKFVSDLVWEISPTEPFMQGGSFESFKYGLMLDARRAIGGVHQIVEQKPQEASSISRSSEEGGGMDISSAKGTPSEATQSQMFSQEMKVASRTSLMPGLKSITQTSQRTEQDFKLAQTFSLKQVFEQKTSQRTEQKQELKVDLRQNIRQEMKQELRQEIRYDFKQDLRQDVRQDYKQEFKQDFRQDFKQGFKQELRQETKQEYKTKQPQVFMPAFTLDETPKEEKKKKKRETIKAAYVPSFTAQVFNITGGSKKTGVFGFEVRPIVKEKEEKRQSGQFTNAQAAYVGAANANKTSALGIERKGSIGIEGSLSRKERAKNEKSFGFLGLGGKK